MKETMLDYFRPPSGWKQVVTETAREIDDDNCLGLAAQLAFYFVLALFPAVLFLVALIGYLPIENALAELLVALAAVAPPELVTLLRGQLEELERSGGASLITIGILGAIWSSSAAMVAIIDALNRAYDITEWRPWWKRRLIALAITVSLAPFLLMAMAFVLIGPQVAQRAAAWIGLAPVVADVWQIIRWPVIVVCVVLGLNLVYHFAPNRRVRWVTMTPGALVATVLWIASSLGFKLYVTHFANYTATYGAIGGAVVTMLWFYVSGFAILVGAELNSVIEEAWRARGREVAPRAEETP